MGYSNGDVWNGMKTITARAIEGDGCFSWRIRAVEKTSEMRNQHLECGIGIFRMWTWLIFHLMFIQFPYYIVLTYSYILYY